MILFHQVIILTRAFALVFFLFSPVSWTLKIRFVSAFVSAFVKKSSIFWKKFGFFGKAKNPAGRKNSGFLRKTATLPSMEMRRIELLNEIFQLGIFRGFLRGQVAAVSAFVSTFFFFCTRSPNRSARTCPAASILSLVAC